MRTEHLTIRIDADALERLGAASRRAGLSRSELARTLLEEGLRIEEHPRIVFRPGPAGRRPALADGMDVWEVIRVFKQVADQEQGAVEETAELIGLNSAQVWDAVRYYADYAEEIDAWIRAVDEQAERAEAAWRRQQALLTR